MSIPAEIGEPLRSVAETYARRATVFRWHTHAGSRGRCWEITQDWARYLRVHGIACELAAFADERPDAHPADRTRNVVLVDGLVWDWQSRGGHVEMEAAPWPRVAVAEWWLADGPRLPRCPTCGATRGDFDAELRAADLEHHRVRRLPVDEGRAPHAHREPYRCHRIRASLAGATSSRASTSCCRRAGTSGPAEWWSRRAVRSGGSWPRLDRHGSRSVP